MLSRNNCFSLNYYSFKNYVQPVTIITSIASEKLRDLII